MSAITRLEELRAGVVEARERVRALEAALQRRRREAAAALAEQRAYYHSVGIGEVEGGDEPRERELAELARAARVPDGAGEVINGAKALVADRAAEVERYITENLPALVAERRDRAIEIGQRRQERATELASADHEWRSEAGWWAGMLRGAGSNPRARLLLDSMEPDPYLRRVDLGAARQESYPCPRSLVDAEDDAA